MRYKQFIAAALATLTFSLSAKAQQVLTGDTRLACEAVLCLASGTRPSECTPSLKRYFSISYRSLSDTLRGRVNFLNLCPASNQTPQMRSFITAIANGAGRCDAGSLNQQLTVWNSGSDGGIVLISNQLPDYCSSYIGNAYSNLGDITPKYVGDPSMGGRWVSADQYDAALAEYNAMINQQWLQQHQKQGGD